MPLIALAMALLAQEKTLYPSSVVGTDFDFWSDLHGAVRITMLDGSVRLNSLEIVAERTPDGDVYTHQEFFPPPIPEPSTTTLLVVGLLTFMICRGLTRHFAETCQCYPVIRGYTSKRSEQAGRQRAEGSRRARDC